MMDHSEHLYQRLQLKLGAFFFRFRNGLLPLIFVMVFLGLAPTLAKTNPPIDVVCTIFGVMTVLAGLAVRLAVIGFAYIKRGGKDGKVYADDLVMSGLYAHSRNPMYLGNMLIAAGIGLLYGSFVMFAVVLPFFLFVYLCIVAAEEQYLQGKFGEVYGDYCRRVPRFLPNLKGLRASLANYRYDWRKGLRKDYGTISSAYAGIIFILVWKSYHLQGISGAQETFENLGFSFLPIVAFYITAYYLKHTGRLRMSE